MGTVGGPAAGSGAIPATSPAQLTADMAAAPRLAGPPLDWIGCGAALRSFRESTRPRGGVDSWSSACLLGALLLAG